MELTQPMAVLLGASIAATVAFVGHGFNAWRDHVARKQSAEIQRRQRARDRVAKRREAEARRREREADLDSRKAEEASRRRHRADDYQRQTLVDLQEAMGALVDAAFELAISRAPGPLFEKPGGVIDRAGLIESRKPVSRYHAAQSRVLALNSRVLDESARTLGADACWKAHELSDANESLDKVKGVGKVASSKYMKFCGRAGELIRAIDAGETASPFKGSPEPGPDRDGEPGGEEQSSEAARLAETRGP